MTSPWAETVVPWCCKHKRTLRYIAVMVTLIFITQVLEIRGVV